MLLAGFEPATSSLPRMCATDYATTARWKKVRDLTLIPLAGRTVFQTGTIAFLIFIADLTTFFAMLIWFKQANDMKKMYPFLLAAITTIAGYVLISVDKTHWALYIQWGSLTVDVSKSTYYK